MIDHLYAGRYDELERLDNASLLLPYLKLLIPLFKQNIEIIPEKLDVVQSQSFLYYIRYCLNLEWNRFHHLLFQHDTWKQHEHMWVTCYLDICIKLFNIANRIEVTMYLTRPPEYRNINSSRKITTSIDTKCRLIITNNYFYYLFLKDKTGRVDTMPSIVSLKPVWRDCLKQYLQKTKFLNSIYVYSTYSGTVWKNASKDIVGFLSTLMHPKITPHTTLTFIIGRQHILRDICINNLACKAKYDQSTLTYIASLVRHSVETLQHFYAKWTRFANSIVEIPEYIDFEPMLENTVVQKDMIGNDNNTDDQYWLSDLYISFQDLPLVTLNSHDIGKHFLPRLYTMNRNPTNADYAYIHVNKIQKVSLRGDVHRSQHISDSSTEFNRTCKHHIEYPIIKHIKLMDKYNPTINKTAPQPLYQRKLKLSKRYYIGIDASPHCIAMCIAHDELFVINENNTKRAHVRYWTYTKNTDVHVSFLAVAEEIKRLLHVHNLRVDEISIAIESPLPNGIFVSGQQQEFTKLLSRYLCTTLKTTLIEISTKQTKLLILSLYKKSTTVDSRRLHNFGGKKLSKSKMYFTLVYHLKYTICDYLHIDDKEKYMVPEYHKDDDIDLKEFVNKSKGHPVSDIVDAIAVAMVLQQLDLYRPAKYYDSVVLGDKI